MNKDLELNYSQGKVLQDLCHRCISDENYKDNRYLYSTWITNEIKKCYRNISEYWGYTKSTESYCRYLSEIKKLIVSDSEICCLRSMYSQICENTRRKIHILFLVQEASSWASIDSVYQAAKCDKDVCETLVFTPFTHINYDGEKDDYDTYVNMGINVVRHSIYDLREDSPDIAFLIKPYDSVPDGYKPKEIIKTVPRIVYIPYGMEINIDLIRFAFQYYVQYKAWRHIAYGEIVKKYGTKYGYCNGNNIVVWGHPKADQYRDLSGCNNLIPQAWKKKINNRKVILWTPHHLISLDKEESGTWLIWGDKILETIDRHKEVCFIIRPHPLLRGNLVTSGGKTKEEVDLLISKIKSKDNIIWDDKPLYHDSFYASDAIITDGTTFAIEYLYTKRPIMLTPRNMKGFYSYQDMMESYYIMHTLDDLEDYIEMINRNQDPLKEKRESFYRHLFFIPESSTVGEVIIENIKKELIKECIVTIP